MFQFLLLLLKNPNIYKREIEKREREAILKNNFAIFHFKINRNKNKTKK